MCLFTPITQLTHFKYILKDEYYIQNEDFKFIFCYLNRLKNLWQFDLLLLYSWFLNAVINESRPTSFSLIKLQEHVRVELVTFVFCYLPSSSCSVKIIHRNFITFVKRIRGRTHQLDTRRTLQYQLLYQKRKYTRRPECNTIIDCDRDTFASWLMIFQV